MQHQVIFNLFQYYLKHQKTNFNSINSEDSNSLRNEAILLMRKCIISIMRKMYNILDLYKNIYNEDNISINLLMDAVRHAFMYVVC